MTEENRYFTDSDTLEDLRRSLPLGWQVSEPDLDSSEVVFSFPFPEHEIKGDGGTYEATNFLIAHYGTENKDQFITGTDPLREDGEIVGRCFIVQGNLPLPNDIITTLTRSSEIIVGACFEELNQAP